MQRYLLALIHDETSDARVLVDCLTDGVGFAVDDASKILSQWRETCNHLVMEDWIVKGIQNGIIRSIASKSERQHKKALKITHGFPYSTRHEGTYVEVAHRAVPHMLVSDDIDFWEPTAKGRPAQEKQNLQTSGSGSVYKYLKNKMGIRVYTPTVAATELGC